MRLPVFDLDGTLVDSDDALTAPFAALGVPTHARPPLGLLLEEACGLAGISVADYLAAYDPSLVRPFPGASELVSRLSRWAVCSHKLRVAGERELAMLGWSPDRAMFAEDFGGRGKALDPLLATLEVVAHDVVFVGDTHHDRACAVAAGATFVLAGWNPRAVAEPGDVVLHHPLDVLDLLGPTAETSDAPGPT